MRLATFMASKSLDDEGMAAILGCTAHAVRKWASGERVPRPEMIARIEKVTGKLVTANDHQEQALEWRAQPRARRRRRSQPTPEVAA